MAWRHDDVKEAKEEYEKSQNVFNRLKKSYHEKKDDPKSRPEEVDQARLIARLALKDASEKFDVYDGKSESLRFAERKLGPKNLNYAISEGMRYVFEQNKIVKAVKNLIGHDESELEKRD